MHAFRIKTTTKLPTVLQIIDTTMRKRILKLIITELTNASSPQWQGLLNNQFKAVAYLRNEKEFTTTLMNVIRKLVMKLVTKDPPGHRLKAMFWSYG